VQSRIHWLPRPTVDPAFYARYLGSVEVLETRAFDSRAGRPMCASCPSSRSSSLNDRFMKDVLRERRGVAVFVPLGPRSSRSAKELGDRWQACPTAFYHGGEPIRVIRPSSHGQVRRPFLLAMNGGRPVGRQHPRLDTVVIYDARYATSWSGVATCCAALTSARMKSFRWRDACTDAWKRARSTS